jgi:hypothetical protein
VTGVLARDQVRFPGRARAARCSRLPIAANHVKDSRLSAVAVLNRCPGPMWLSAVDMPAEKLREAPTVNSPARQRSPGTRDARPGAFPHRLWKTCAF